MNNNHFTDVVLSALIETVPHLEMQTLIPFAIFTGRFHEQTSWLCKLKHALFTALEISR